jgi:hypothetical protein
MLEVSAINGIAKSAVAVYLAQSLGCKGFHNWTICHQHLSVNIFTLIFVSKWE